jgi:hypothetical protein
MTEKLTEAAARKALPPVRGQRRNAAKIALPNRPLFQETMCDSTGTAAN